MRYAIRVTGACACHPFTCAEFQTTIMGADASGRGQGAAWRLGDLNVPDLGAEAIAKKAGVQSTGHALPPAERSFGAMACNLFMAPGSSTYQDLLNSIPRGLLITRFWYTRLVKARDCVMTGMTRDGVFWVENGAVQYPVRNLRFTQSYSQSLADVIAVGDRAPLLKAQYGQVFARVPALAIQRFRFTS